MRTIVHLSDLHFGRIDRRLVLPLVDAISVLGPDLVAVSGDLTQRARQRQFTEARAFLEALPFPRLIVPGNHDIPFFDVARRFLSPLGRYRRFIAEDVEPIHVDAEMVVVGLGACAPGLIKIIVTHHPFDLPDDYDARHLVGRAKRAMAQLASVGADLFLAGHLHVSHIGHTAERYKIEGHSALVVQAGTISNRLRGEANSFNVLRLERPHITVSRRSWDEDRETFIEHSVRAFQHSDRGWIECEGAG